MGYFLLIGTISFRNSSSTACNETARFTPSSTPQRSISGTTPAVGNFTQVSVRSVTMGINNFTTYNNYKGESWTENY